MLNDEFEMKKLGPAKKILGMEICRDRTKGKLLLTQHTYWAKKLLAQHLFWEIVIIVSYGLYKAG